MSAFPVTRLRRLRRTSGIRSLVRETRLDLDDFVMPLFVGPEAFANDDLPGLARHSVVSVVAEAAELERLGVRAVILFGIPEEKDEEGSGAYDDDGIVQRALRALDGSGLVLLTDVCLCEYTSHGHCGVIRDGEVSNDETLELIARTAVSHVDAGAHAVCPSDMMDGRVAAIREELPDTPIVAYSAKYASAFYGPFREAAESAPAFGDRRGYQMDPANVREALRECEQDVAEGADVLMIKPALPYLDVIRAARERFDLPLAAYNVSGEYAMVKAAAAKGFLDEPLFVRRGEGAYIEDVDGNRYVDWVMSWGPLLFGHADHETVAAVVEAVERGTSFGAPTEAEVGLAAEIVDAVPSVEKVRLVSSGTEAAMSAVRLARAFTSRDRIIKFAGCYHGHADALLASAGSGLATLGLPLSPGVPAATTSHTIVCPYNDVDAIAAAVAQYGEGLAAILVEPVAGNMGVVPPQPGFLDVLRALCHASGALLVFDEVISGFRVARGGAQELYGVTPDLTILGKIVGGGLPLAAFGGRAEIMDRLAPSGDVYQAGTLSGNPLATAAGLAALGRLRDAAVYEELERRGARLEAGLGAHGRVQRVGAMATLFMTEEPVRNFDDAQRADTDRYGALFRHLLQRGIYIAPSQVEAMFVSLAHGDEEIDRTIQAVADYG